MKIFLFIDETNIDLNNELIDFCKNKFDILNIFDNSNLYDNTKYNDDIDFSISFLNGYIIKDNNILNKKCINFHPSTQKYRGVCGSVLALYNDDEYFGCTAHYINSNVDDGGIISVNTFKIDKNIDCYELSKLSKRECLHLSFNLLMEIYNSNNLPSIDSNLYWGEILMTRKKFKDWMIVNIEDNVELQKKIKACKNKVFPGPFIKIDNKLYSLQEIT
jgi:methionyl-tRNA formyltransferase